MKIVKTFLHTVFTAVTFIAFALACILFVTTRKSPLFGVHSFSVLSGSMTPSYPVGSVVFTQPANQYELGDTIAFTRKGVTVTHRIISYKNAGEGRTYVVKGDANNIPDLEHVKAKDIIGRVFISLPLFGRVMTLLHTPIGLFAIIGTPALLLILHEIWTIKTEFEIVIEKKVRKKLQKEIQETIRAHIATSKTANG